MSEKVSVDTGVIKNTLLKALDLRASDIHITAMKRPVMRIDGILTELKDLEVWQELHVLAFFQMLQIRYPFSGAESEDSLNTSFTMNGTRFRMHAYKSFTGVSVALRVIPLEIPEFDNLNLPNGVRDLIKNKNGLVLVTGSTGSGKSTTLASLLNEVNNDPEGKKLIVTVENPIEFLYEETNARIIQREVGKNVKSFGSAVVDAMREDPDIILIGELQDKDAIRNALTLAETGHLVLASLHTNGAAETFDRILDAFPGDDHAQIRTKLANSLQGIVHQRLVKKSGTTGRIPLVEVLTLDDADVRNQLRNNSSVTNVNKLMKEKSGKGLISIERSAAMLVKNGLLDIEDAVKYADVKKEDINRILNTL